MLCGQAAEYGRQLIHTDGREALVSVQPPAAIGAHAGHPGPARPAEHDATGVAAVEVIGVREAILAVAGLRRAEGQERPASGATEDCHAPSVAERTSSAAAGAE